MPWRAAPSSQRLLAWPLADLPLSCNALVLTPADNGELILSGTAMARALTTPPLPLHRTHTTLQPGPPSPWLASLTRST
jgi:hypothetical protein